MTSKAAPFDELDRKIIAALIDNGRASFAEIGGAIGLSATAVKRRVDRLRESKVITGFSATVRPSALGWLTEAYVEVYCDSAAPPRRLAEVVRNHPEIAAAMTVTGGADALLHVRRPMSSTSRRYSNASGPNRSSARRSATWCCPTCCRRARRPAPADPSSRVTQKTCRNNG